MNRFVNNLNQNKPEFSLQLQVEERSLEILKFLIRRRDWNLTVTTLLCFQVAESDITLSSFTSRDPFSVTFDGKTTKDDQDGNNIDLLDLPLETERGQVLRMNLYEILRQESGCSMHALDYGIA